VASCSSTYSPTRSRRISISCRRFILLASISESARRRAGFESQLRLLDSFLSNDPPALPEGLAATPRAAAHGEYLLLGAGIESTKLAAELGEFCLRSRPSTGATSKTVMEMVVVIDLASRSEVTAAEADLYLNWAGDLLTPARMMTMAIARRTRAQASPNRLRAVGYCRVSTKRQADHQIRSRSRKGRSMPRACFAMPTWSRPSSSPA